MNRKTCYDCSNHELKMRENKDYKYICHAKGEKYTGINADEWRNCEHFKQTAKINSAWFNGHCNECGCSIVYSIRPIPENEDGDYSVYCSNPTCKNHTASNVCDFETPYFMLEEYVQY